MPPTSALLAFTDIIAMFDRALTNGKGVRIFCGPESLALHLRARAYRARELDRASNKNIYTPDEPMFGRSVYDALLFTPRMAEDETWFLYIEASTPAKLEDVMEDLE